MIYQKFLDLIKKNNFCPFCNLKKELIIKKNRFAVLTLARAPYTKDHLLIIPKRHVLELKDLKRKEKDSIMNLIVTGLEIFHKKYKGVEVSYKEGKTLDDAQKTILHAHFHLVPKKNVKNPKVDKRNFLSEKKLISETKKIKELMKK